MSEQNEGKRGESEQEQDRPAEVKEPFSWRRYLILLVIGLAAAVLAYLFAVAFLPRWWAQRVADQVNAKMGAGVGWGLFYGIVFTLLPLLLLRQAARDVSSRTRWILIVVAVVLAIPNLLTLAVVLGTGKGAHAGQRILDVSGPGFRVATLIGVIGAAVVTLAVFAVLASGRRDRRRLRELKERGS
jgi:flagellar basal body-associated protein FliL